MDRNPSAIINSYPEDIFDSNNFSNCVKNSSLVLSCPDLKSVREYVNDVCVENKVPFVTASVFRTGIGGEIFAYIPNQTGCFRCLQLFALRNNLNLTDEALGLTNEEENKIYGLGERDFVAWVYH